jgi:hypothetical protein
MKKTALLLSADIRVAIKTNDNADRQNKDNEFIVIRHALKESQARYRYAFFGVVRLETSEAVI